MKVIDQTKKQYEAFKDIWLGEVFLAVSRNFAPMMKIEGKDVNAVGLENGLTYVFDDDMEVVKVNAMLVINNG